MKDLPYTFPHESTTVDLEYLEFKLGLDVTMRCWSCTPLDDPDIRLWQFEHLHPELSDSKKGVYYQIKKDKCILCNKKFPPFKSLVTYVRLVFFNNPRLQTVK
jgi:hypothetical protein